MDTPQKRAAFFVSDGTGISAETLGHSLLTQFEGVEFTQVRIPFVNSAAKALECARRISETCRQDGVKPLVFSTLVDPEANMTLRTTDALVIDLFAAFIGPLEEELGVSSTHTIGRSHSVVNNTSYMERIEAVNYTLSHDDGATHRGLEQADVILVGVSRSGKTPTSLYLALQFGIKSANYPLIPEDFLRQELPAELARHQGKLFGLTINPQRLQQIRTERRPNSKYASLANCYYEIEQAELLMRREGIRCLDSTTKSIEEIAATIMQELNISDYGQTTSIQKFV